MVTKPSVPSDSIQMYLVHIFRLSKAAQPVPLSQLAAALNVSPISVNQMCRKLHDEGLVEYTPYKGVALTPAGQQLAARVLRGHRLWEVFLVEHLQLRWQEAHETACLLEHDTPDPVVERLAAFLQHPRVNPEGEPIPDAVGTPATLPAQSLSQLRVGQKGTCLRCTADEASIAFLLEQGLRPGAPIQMVAAGPQSILVEVSGHKVTLGRSLAETVQVEAEDWPAHDEQDERLSTTSTNARS